MPDNLISFVNQIDKKLSQIGQMFEYSVKRINQNGEELIERLSDSFENHREVFMNFRKEVR